MQRRLIAAAALVLSVLAASGGNARAVELNHLKEGDYVYRPEDMTVFWLYRGYLERAPDAGGFVFWVNQFRDIQCKKDAAAIASKAVQIGDLYYGSKEYTDRTSPRPDSTEEFLPGHKVEEYVRDLYFAYLRRDPEDDKGGWNFWVSEIKSGKRTADSIRDNDFPKSPEFSGLVRDLIAAGCVNNLTSPGSLTGPRELEVGPGTVVDIPLAGGNKGSKGFTFSANGDKTHGVLYAINAKGQYLIQACTDTSGTDPICGAVTAKITDATYNGKDCSAEGAIGCVETTIRLNRKLDPGTILNPTTGKPIPPPTPETPANPYMPPLIPMPKNPLTLSAINLYPNANGQYGYNCGASGGRPGYAFSLGGQCGFETTPKDGDLGIKIRPNCLGKDQVGYCSCLARDQDGTRVSRETKLIGAGNCR